MHENETLTPKQAKFLDVYFQTGNSTEAAMQAYDCKDRLSARNIGSENLAKLGISMDDVMEEMGLTAGYLISRLKDLINAKKKLFHQDQDGNLIVEEINDYAAMAKGIHIALKLGNMYPSPLKSAPPQSGIPFPERLYNIFKKVANGERPPEGNELGS